MLAVRAGSRAFGRGSFSAARPRQPQDPGLPARAHGFFWFRLAADAAPPDWHVDRMPVEDLPVLVLFDGWNSFFRRRVVPWRIAMAEKTLAQLEGELLPRFLQRQRWFCDTLPSPARCTVTESPMLESGDRQWLLALVDVPSGTEPTRWFVPLAVSFEDHEEERTRALAPMALSRVRQQAVVGVLADASGDEAYCRALVQAIGESRELRSDGGRLRFVPGANYRQVVGDALAGPLPLTRLTVFSNSLSLLGERLFVKTYRRQQPGINPELEMGRHLADVAGYRQCVPVAGSVEYVTTDGTVFALALLQAQVPHQGDARSLVIDLLSRLFEAYAAGTVTLEDGLPATGERVQVLARRIAELHVALARPGTGAAFEPEPVQAEDLASWAQAVEDDLQRARQALSALEVQRRQWPAPLAELAARVADAAPQLAQRIAGIRAMAPTGLKTRLHGDLHLGQILVSQDDFVLIDFEGEPSKPFQERRAKHSALRDVAGMLRSFDEARHAALQQAALGATDHERLRAAVRQWAQQMRAGFLRSYAEVAVAGRLYPDTAAFEAAQPLIALFELGRALQELHTALERRPDTLAVALAGLATLAGAHD
jgi:maltose alpha-D-glucosyltransferase / alpha-amylase